MEQETDPQNHPITEQSKWLVASALAHGLGIAIAVLMTVVIDVPGDDKPVLLSTPLVQSEQISEHVCVLKSPTEFTPAVTNEPEDAKVLINVVAESMQDTILLNEEFERFQPDVAIKENNSEAAINALEESKNAESTLLHTEQLIGPDNSIAAYDADQWGSSQSSPLTKSPSFAGSTASFDNLNLDAFSRSSRPRVIRCYFCCGQKEASSIEWLVKHQEPDGSWSSTKHGASVKSDTAVTGLALLALLSSGNTEKFGRQKECVQRAVAWLMSKQNADGMIWDSSDDGAGHRAKGYPCAIASLALIEAGGMANIPSTRAAGQKAVDYICNVHQSVSGGWRYAPGSEGDLSVTGWYVMALKSAKVAGFQVPEQSLEKALAFVRALEVKETNTEGTNYSRYKYSPTEDHLASAHRLTAIGTLMRQFTGTRNEELQTTAEWFVSKGGLPSYGTNGANVDLYYWYYASLALYQQQRVQPELWTTWCESMLAALGNSQCKVGDDYGSWDPVGAYSNEWGRVGQTALSALCLATWHRYRAISK